MNVHSFLDVHHKISLWFICLSQVMMSQCKQCMKLFRYNIIHLHLNGTKCLIENCECRKACRYSFKPSFKVDTHLQSMCWWLCWFRTDSNMFYGKECIYRLMLCTWYIHIPFCLIQNISDAPFQTFYLEDVPLRLHIGRHNTQSVQTRQSNCFLFRVHVFHLFRRFGDIFLAGDLGSYITYKKYEDSTV